jgi:hypothetical protein
MDPSKAGSENPFGLVGVGVLLPPSRANGGPFRPYERPSRGWEAWDTVLCEWAVLPAGERAK